MIRNAVMKRQENRPVQVILIFPIIRRHFNAISNISSHTAVILRTRILSGAVRLYQQKRRQFLVASDVS